MTQFSKIPDLKNLSYQDAAKKWLDWWEDTYLAMLNESFLHAEKQFLQDFINNVQQDDENAKT